MALVRTFSFVVFTLGALLSLLATADYFAHWGICGSNACEDPRFRELGSIFGIPVTLIATGLYAGLAVHSFQFRNSDNTKPALLPAIATGILVGGHLYFSWLQANVLHSWCLLCLGITACGLTGLLSLLVLSRGTRFRFSCTALSAAMIPILLLSLTQHKIWSVTAPDPLTQGTGPSIYRPADPGPTAPKTLVEQIQAGKTEGPENAEVFVDIFTDLQCPKCAEFETKIWPEVKKQLGADYARIRVTHRIFLLEGHPQGWQGAFVALAASKEGYFAQVMQELFHHQQEWVTNGNVYEVAQRSLPLDKKVSEWMKNTEVLQAAKAVIRTDVAFGARESVQAAPSVVVLKSGSAKSTTLISGVMEVQRYVTALKAAF